MRTILAASVIGLTLGFGTMSSAGQLDAVTDTAKKVGEVTKEGAETVGKATKKGVEKTKTVVTGEARAKCVDGTRQTRKTMEAARAACAKHGGVTK